MTPPTFTISADDPIGRQLMAYYARLARLEADRTRDYDKLKAAEAKHEEFKAWHRSSAQGTPPTP